MRVFNIPLIVPYGIEMMVGLDDDHPEPPLIVPYGIEMGLLASVSSMLFPLIVPYGIEITIFSGITPPARAFNRTIWN